MALLDIIPPGPRYLSSLLPYLLTPGILVFTFFRLHNVYLPTSSIPNWLIFLLSFFARPVVFVFQRYYTRYVDRKNAEANNAFVIPHVEEKRPHFGGLSLMKVLVEDIKTGYPGSAFRKWSEQYGNTYQIRFPTDNRIITNDPDHIKAILSTQFDTFDKGPIMHHQFHSLLGTGVFNSDGSMWKFHRAISRPFFTRDRISDFDIFDRHAAHALALARVRLASGTAAAKGEGYALDFQDLVSRFTLDSATEFLFGYEVDSLSAGLPYASVSANKIVDNMDRDRDMKRFREHPSNVFVDAFLDGQVRTAMRTRYGPTWPVTAQGEFWRDRVMEARRVMDGYLVPVMERALEEKREKKRQGVKEKGEGETLLAHLVEHTEDIQILKDELLNLLVAGRDTTGCTLTFAFYMLAEHPDVATRLRREVLERVGEKERPTYENLRELRYMRAFVNEVLRLYPPVPFDSRMSNKATVWHSKTPGSKPFYVPANTRILYSIFNLHRRTDLWGPTALEFDPDRFLDERAAKYLTPNPFIFCPFNAGPRICLGQQFAYQEISFFLVRLLQQFTNFRLVQPEEQPEESRPPMAWALDEQGRKEKVRLALHLTLYAAGGVWGRMDEVKGSELE